MHPLVCLVAVAATAAAAEEDLSLVDRLRLEAHGFVTFGYLRTWNNAWLADDSQDGTSEFHEAALNAIARPLDRLRLGAQLFTRDLGRYDNGRAQLDWAYADWRFADALGVQVGRVKYPLGLFNDLIDYDAGRTPVFLPSALYALRNRDTYVSLDGGLAYGAVNLGGSGDLDWTLYAGRKDYSAGSGTVTLAEESGLGSPVTDAGSALIAGGMVHWYTPIPDLGMRLSYLHHRDYEVEGRTPFGEVRTDIDHVYTGIASLIYECGAWTVAAEYGRLGLRGEAVFTPPGLGVRLDNDLESGYVSVTWRVRPWLDLYVAGEAAYEDAGHYSSPHAGKVVFAVAVRPLREWTLKAQFDHIDGTLGLLPQENPEGAREVWQTLAVTTTVDF